MVSLSKFGEGRFDIVDDVKDDASSWALCSILMLCWRPRTVRCSLSDELLSPRSERCMKVPNTVTKRSLQLYDLKQQIQSRYLAIKMVAMLFDHILIPNIAQSSIDPPSLDLADMLINNA